MKRIVVCVLLGIIASAPRLSAQHPNSGLAQLSELSRHGPLPQLIQAANSLLANQDLTPADQGIVLTYLAHAYQLSGDFNKATANYENALAIIDRDGHHPDEYAMVLGALATLYAETGQTNAAKHLLLRSARLLEQQNDHAQAAMIWNDLATLAADEHSRRDAHKYMARSLAQSQLAPDFTSDQIAALTSTQASIAELDGDPRAAVAGYQHALALWKQTHEDQLPETAWLYVLLGGAYLQSGDIASARVTTARGLSLLEAGSGRQSPRYVSAELAYAKILDASGASDQAFKLRTEAAAAAPAAQRTPSQISIFALR